MRLVDRYSTLLLADLLRTHLGLDVFHEFFMVECTVHVACPLSPAVPDDALHAGIRDLLVDARAHVARSVNTAMVRTYWNIGGLIDDHLQAETRSESYGTDLMGRLATQLADEFGSGLDRTNLHNMQRFFRAFDIRDAARLESSDSRVPIDVSLSWTHYQQLARFSL